MCCATTVYKIAQRSTDNIMKEVAAERTIHRRVELGHDLRNNDPTYGCLLRTIKLLTGDPH